jgi:hypothetical protein
LNEVLAKQKKHQTMHAMSLLKHVVVVIRKSECMQQRCASCGTCLFAQLMSVSGAGISQATLNENLKWVLRAQKAEHLGAISVCLL